MSIDSIEVSTGKTISDVIAESLNIKFVIEHIGGMKGQAELVDALKDANRLGFVVAAAAHMALKGPFGLDGKPFAYAKFKKSYSVREIIGSDIGRETWNAFVRLVAARIKTLDKWESYVGPAIRRACGTGKLELYPDCPEIVPVARGPQKNSTSKRVANVELK